MFRSRLDPFQLVVLADSDLEAAVLFDANSTLAICPSNVAEYGRTPPTQSLAPELLRPSDDATLEIPADIVRLPKRAWSKALTHCIGHVAIHLHDQSLLVGGIDEKDTGKNGPTVPSARFAE